MTHAMCGACKHPGVRVSPDPGASVALGSGFMAGSSSRALRSEVLALQWDDVDLDAGTLSVHRTV